MSLGLYRYPRNSQAAPEEDTRYVEHILLALNREGAPEIEEGARIGQIVSEAASFARTWVNHPSNIATAPALESETRAIADRLGLRISILDSGQLAQEQMGLLIAVGRGATTHPPRMIVLEHRPDGQSATDPIVLIGKGILFDSGGYSLKSWKSMFGMNGDMAGSAVVLGAMQAVAELGLPLHVVALAPIVENLVGPEAYKPNDVLFAKNGKSVEIRSTDAEGRLILADALCYADALNPAAVIDVATLTGSKVAALGPRTNALFCNNDQLANSLMRAGQTAGEPLWRMPLDPAYDRQLRSRVADIINSGGGTSAGSITAARFLAHFVGAWPWAHIDSAGSTSYNDSAEYTPRSYLTKGATDIPLRTLVEYLREVARTEASVPPGEDGR
jgi:leucyl aminopeptidase